jgi:signal transduction histidine kinase
MNQFKRPIEQYFLDTLLKIALVSILIVMAVDFYFTRFFVIRSLIVNVVVLVAILTAFMLHKQGFFKTAVLWIGFLIMTAMFYQSIESDSITTSSMAVVMVIGFGFSILLSGRLPLFLHAITIIGMIAIFVWMALHPHQYGKPNASDIIVAGITYVMLYIVIGLSSWRLRKRYDEVLAILVTTNRDLIDKTHEIEMQNEELVQSQENLYQLNTHLESLVDTRTQEVTKRNEQLIRYTYANAHHLRGPVARVLGLIQLSKMDTTLDFPFIFQKVEEQVLEIDEVVKGINRELES